MLRAVDANRDAINGLGHSGEPHDRMLHFEPCCAGAPAMHVYSTSAGCAACGGAQYGTGDELNAAHGDLRAALAMERLPWEYERPEPAEAPA